jgi:hypothetical protein|tara:strand:+ start:603 stop:707 length:105 start_codon:yes stop_codon:yes gene_type:complete
MAAHTIDEKTLNVLSITLTPVVFSAIHKWPVVPV